MPKRLSVTGEPQDGIYAVIAQNGPVHIHMHCTSHRSKKLCQVSLLLPLCKLCTHLDSSNCLTVKGYWRIMDWD